MNYQIRAILRYLFVVLFGVFLHFAYDFSGNNFLVGLFSTVNESIWEHLKLIFYPMLVLTLYDALSTPYDGLQFIIPRTKGTLFGMLFMIVAYYTITGIIGKDIAWFNIVLYLLSILFAFCIQAKSQNKRSFLSIRTAIHIWVLFIVLFTIVTFAPPAFGIFIPPT